LLVACLGTIGCVQIESRKQPADSIRGVPYSLPKKSFVLNVEYQLKECAVQEGQVILNVDRKAALASAVVPDPTERYYVPYDSLRNWFKATDFTVESQENQTLKSISATIEDKTASAISSVVSTMVALAPAALPGAAPAAPPPASAPISNPCTKETLHALKRVKELKRKAKATPAGATVDEEITVELDRINELLTQKYTLTWTPTKADRGARAIVPTEAIAKWLALPIAPHLAQEVHKLNTTIEFLSEETIPSAAFVPPDPADGVLVRLPINGVVRVCKGFCPSGQDANAVIATQEHVVPQLGPYVVLPLHNRIFETNTVTLVIADTGVITKLGYKTNAGVEAASASLSANVDAIQKARTDRDKAKKEAAAAAQNASKEEANRVAEDNKAITACIEAQKALRGAGGIPVGNCQP